MQDLDEHYRVLDVNKLLSRKVHEIDFDDIHDQWCDEFNKDFIEDSEDINHSVVINNITPQQFESIILSFGDEFYRLKLELFHNEINENTPKGQLKRAIYDAFTESENLEIQRKFINSHIPRLVDDICDEISKKLNFELKENK